MHFRGLDLNLLVALDALITERSISRTGEKIHLSQSATSGTLARLREYFKDDLLVPVGRKMVLTPLAEDLAQPVRQLLVQAEAIIHRSPAFSPEKSDRTFRLIMSDYVTTVLMSRALPEIQRQAPGITVQVLVPGAKTDALERGEADMMIMPKQYLSENHPSEPLFEDDFVCIAWTGICSRRVISLFSPVLSSSGGTLGGGSGGGVPRMFSSTHTPRFTGDVRKFCCHVRASTLP